MQALKKLKIIDQKKSVYNFTISRYAFTSPNLKFPSEKRDAMLPAPLRSLPRLGAQHISRPRSPTNCRPHLTNKSRVVAKTYIFSWGNVHKKHETSVNNLWCCPIFYVNESILYHFFMSFYVNFQVLERTWKTNSQTSHFMK